MPRWGIVSHEAEDPANSSPLAGEHLLLTGGTGFLGQALLERILSSYPDTRVTLLVRAKGSASGADRLDMLLRKQVFSRWRKAVGPDAVRAAVAERVRTVEADLGGADIALPDDITAVIHAAGTVSFDPPIDEAFQTNVAGVDGLYQAVSRLPSAPHVVHVSTAYVRGACRGTVPEEPLDHDVDWRVELTGAREARESVERESRRPETLRKALAEGEREHGKSGPQSAAAGAEKWRKEWVAKQLVERGRLRAKTLGWPDVYTFTKALGERVAEQRLTGRVALSVVRPAIVESALRHPYPGWIDGFKMADPLIIAYGRGTLREFPGVADGVIDLIPVDIVVNAVLGAAAAPPPVDRPAYYHVSSGARNPLTFRALYETVREYFEGHPMPDGGRGQIKAPRWDFPGSRRVDRMLRTGERVLTAAQRALQAAPRSNMIRRWQDDITSEREKVDFLRYYADIYGVYAETEVRYTDYRLLALHRSLDAERVDEHGFDAAVIDWTHYLQRVHCPAITATVRRRDGVSTRSGRGTLPALSTAAGTNQVAVFDMEGTLVASNMIETYLLARLADLPRSAWAPEVAHLARALPRYLAAERRDRSEFLRTFLRRYAEADEAGLSRLVNDGLGEALLRRAYPEAVRRIRQHRAAGHRTVLITGALDVLVQPLAPLFDEVVASRLHARDGRYSGYLESPPLVGEARAAWLRHYAEHADVSLAGSYAYGDSYSDRPLLEAVGHPVAVNPDVQLYRHAKANRWVVAEWSSYSMPAGDTFAEIVG